MDEVPLGWFEAENPAGVCISVFRNRFKRGPVIHQFVATVVPIDDTFETEAQVTLLTPNGPMSGPTQMVLWKDHDQAVKWIEEEYDRQKQAWADNPNATDE